MIRPRLFTDARSGRPCCYPLIAGPMPTHGNFVDRTGQRFGSLKVLSYMGKRAGYPIWKCLCDCGSIAEVDIKALVQLRCAACKVCSEYKRRAKISRSQLTHGMTHSTEYKIYWNMITRCRNRNNGGWRYYGGRGVTICSRWVNGENGKTGFECFYEDMGKRPSLELSLDRKDNNGNYEPSNCRWATRQEQSANKRPSRRTKPKLRRPVLHV